MRIQDILALADQGFWLFPVVPDGKLPAIKSWQLKATRDTAQLQEWFCDSAKNAGIFTGAFGEDEALIVVDIDVKHGKNGEETLLLLELEGKEFPTTLEQRTASGGRHLIYKTKTPRQQGVDVLGSGLDIRSHGGFIVAPGSRVGGGEYTLVNAVEVAYAPSWLEEQLAKPRARTAKDYAELPGIDESRAAVRAAEFLKTAPIAVEGQGGDALTFKTCAKLKDLGCSADEAVSLLAEHWNYRCAPPWDYEDLKAKVKNAFNYGAEPRGISAPEAVFQVNTNVGEKLHPIQELNKCFASVMIGGKFYVLWESKDAEGNPDIRLLNTSDFENMLAGERLSFGEKTIPLAKAWLESPDRRKHYGGMAFAPNEDLGPDWFNMWRGFSTLPADSATHPMVERWKEHLLENVCGNDPTLAHWLTCWFAHLIQKPGNKPLVGLVFRGKKGTGKNTLVERVMKLLGPHGMVTSRRRYLVSNFTSHLQRCLMFVLDEAFWSGDKEAEGIIKDLVTGTKHTIEPKGKESYDVRNLTRVVIIGNEEWLVPATEDERRWAVFTLGEGRRLDHQYFEELRIGLDEKGGNAYLLRYLLDYKIDVNINIAPETGGLVEQKLASLDLLAQWWHSCLEDREIAGGDMDGWPTELPTKRLQQAFERYAKSRNARSRLPNSVWFGRALTKMGLAKTRAKDPSGKWQYGYLFEEVDVLRERFAQYLGGEIKWQE